MIIVKDDYKYDRNSRFDTADTPPWCKSCKVLVPFSVSYYPPTCYAYRSESKEREGRSDLCFSQNCRICAVLKILKRKKRKDTNERQEKFQSLPSHFSLFLDNIFHIINNDFSVFYSTFLSFLERINCTRMHNIVDRQSTGSIHFQNGSKRIYPRFFQRWN